MTTVSPPRIGDAVKWSPPGVKGSFPAKIIDRDAKRDRYLLDANVFGIVWVNPWDIQIGANN